MKKEVIYRVTELINNNINEFDVEWIKGNLFLMSYKDKLELTSIWHRDEKTKLYGANTKYLNSSKFTIFVKDEFENEVLTEKVYLIPSSFLLELVLYEDDNNNNRKLPYITNDELYLKGCKPHDIKRYRIL